MVVWTFTRLGRGDQWSVIEQFGNNADVVAMTGVSSSPSVRTKSLPSVNPWKEWVGWWSSSSSSCVRPRQLWGKDHKRTAAAIDFPPPPSLSTGRVSAAGHHRFPPKLSDRRLLVLVERCLPVPQELQATSVWQKWLRTLKWLKSLEKI